MAKVIQTCNAENHFGSGNTTEVQLPNEKKTLVHFQLYSIPMIRSFSVLSVLLFCFFFLKKHSIPFWTAVLKRVIFLYVSHLLLLLKMIQKVASFLHMKIFKYHQAITTQLSLFFKDSSYDTLATFLWICWRLSPPFPLINIRHWPENILEVIWSLGG